MKEVIDSENYIWIITANSYAKEEFVKKFFKGDAKSVVASEYFYYMNAEISASDYNKGKKLSESLFANNENNILPDLNFTGDAPIHYNGLKPYVIYAKSLQVMATNNNKHDLKISNFEIFLFDNNNRELLINNCAEFNITFINVTDFSDTPIPNLVYNFNRILTDQKTKSPAETAEPVGTAVLEELPEPPKPPTGEAVGEPPKPPSGEPPKPPTVEAVAGETAGETAG